ncbi:MAG: MFS transporter [Chromatiales bacterium 21-64-14]|nr:MAG: MFS transporter [Chromatiales bacterium 21-64-14]HQU15811.1 DHA2 family efflux MFS transporter permease subunit [Gammaproteobacteria bacterium]
MRANHRFLITIAVMSATVMQVLDTTIVNVALPHMEGQLSATPDEISWVLTSYLVASGIFMPMTGYFTDRLGQKKYLLLSIFGFVVASVLSGLSVNLTQIVFFRLLQGVFGAALVPLSQSILVNTYPPEERGKAMAIWGIGVMVGPILGPTLGGYLTQVLSWRWTFFINVPVGIFSLLAAWRVVPDTERRQRSMDWTGLVLLSMAIGGLQFVLDRGNQDDWFDAHTIQIATLLSVVGFLGFAWHGLLHREKALFDLRIFKDRNFSTSSLLLAVFGLGLYGMLVLQPMLLESLLNYPTFTTGLVMAPRGVASMFSMFLVGRLINRIGPRPLITTGILLSIVGTFATTHYSLYIDPFWVIWPVMVQGLGLGMIFVPLAAVAFTTLNPRQSAEAAGIFSLVRTIGSSIGISIVTTVMTRHAQIAWNQIGGHLQPFNPALYLYLDRLQLSPGDPRAAAVLGYELGRQAQMVALVDAFTLIAWSFVCMLPLVLLLRSSGRARTANPTPALE